MDHTHTMLAALDRKTHQYDEAIAAVQRAQEPLLLSKRTVRIVNTIPLVFGVRGAVAHAEAIEGLKWFKLSSAKMDRILAQGVRAAITGASDLCTTRFEVIHKVPGAPRLPNGKRQRVIIPPKPHCQQVWRADRGGGGEKIST